MTSCYALFAENNLKQSEISLDSTNTVNVKTSSILQPPLMYNSKLSYDFGVKAAVAYTRKGMTMTGLFTGLAFNVIGVLPVLCAIEGDSPTFLEPKYEPLAYKKGFKEQSCKIKRNRFAVGGFIGCAISLLYYKQFLE